MGTLQESALDTLEHMTIVLCYPWRPAASLIHDHLGPENLSPHNPYILWQACSLHGHHHNLLLSDSHPLGSSFPGSLSVLLDDLQGLSEAISKEEAISQGDNQNSPATVCQ